MMNTTEVQTGPLTTRQILSVKCPVCRAKPRENHVRARRRTSGEPVSVSSTRGPHSSRGIVGASFGPIIGAMVADYLLSGKKWSGPREGVNMAGYIAWAVGFIVGILPLDVLPITLSPEMKSYVQPAVVYSFIVGFVVYYALAKAGMQSKTVAMPKAA